MRPYMQEQMYPYMPQMMMMPRGGMPGYPPMAQSVMPPMGQMPPMAQMAPYPAQMPAPVPMPVPEVNPPEANLPTDKEQLGERLYPMVEKLDAKNASKITGMLLEMEIEQLHGIIRDPAQLTKWINEARSVLDNSAP